MVKIEVKNCKNCIFSVVDYMNGDKVGDIAYYRCEAPLEIHGGEYEIADYYESNKIAPFCPLKKQSLKIEFKK